MKKRLGFKVLATLFFGWFAFHSAREGDPEGCAKWLAFWACWMLPDLGENAPTIGRHRVVGLFRGATIYVFASFGLIAQWALGVFLLFEGVLYGWKCTTLRPEPSKRVFALLTVVFGLGIPTLGEAVVWAVRSVLP